MKMGRTWKLILAAGGVTAGLLLACFFVSLAGKKPVVTAPIGKSIVTPRIVGNWGRVIIVAADGTLWGWGNSATGELGIRTPEACGPRQISGVPCWTEAGTGGFTVALRNDGTLWEWGGGRSTAGNVGDPSKPVQVGSGTNWIHIAVGASHYVAQKVDGTLWTWGENSLGQLGDGSLTERKEPIQIGSGPWKTFAVGSFHSAAIAHDGTLWEWGRLGAGGNTGLSQVGDDTNWVAVSSGEFHTMAKKSDGSWWIWGDSAGTMTPVANVMKFRTVVSPVKILDAQSWVSVAGGNAHTLALDNDGSLWGLGFNSQGELGDGTKIQRNSPVQVASLTNCIVVGASGLSSVGITGDGTVFVWGVRAEIPARTSYSENILRMLPGFFSRARPVGTFRGTKEFSSSTKPVAIMRFQPVAISDTNSPALRSNSTALPASGKQ